MRHRAAGVVINDGKLLVMFRRNRHEYYVFPGGGIEPGETPEQAVVRELWEETSIKATVDRLIFELHHDNGEVHHYFLCKYVEGEPALQTGTPEHDEIMAGTDYYEPRWLELTDIGEVTLYPDEATTTLFRFLKDGFPDAPLSVPALAH